MRSDTIGISENYSSSRWLDHSPPLYLASIQTDNLAVQSIHNNWMCAHELGLFLF
jgi:hypothetical protein